MEGLTLVEGRVLIGAGALMAAGLVLQGHRSPWLSTSGGFLAAVGVGAVFAVLIVGTL